MTRTVQTVTRRRTFTELRQHGSRVQHGTVRMTYLASPTVTDGERPGDEWRRNEWQGPKVAYAFSRRFGKAVQRNRARRRLRDAFARGWSQHAEGNTNMSSLDGAFLLSGHRALLTAPFETVVSDVAACLNKLSAQ